jgi:hypothetical protein
LAPEPLDEQAKVHLLLADALACLALVRALQQWPIRPLPGVRAGDAAAGTFADGHYARRYAILPFAAIG